ncbi:MAG: SUMF1/EgtB/PvdO family nonheme iron enzyme [Fibrobacteres bacterium]|nr:SUMF1/EgtB/PvdO family nonheme iron enzyme [Fibrobacterota bacterium]
MRRGIASLALVVVSSCRLSHVVATDPIPVPSVATGWARLLPLSGKVLRIGSDDPLALPEERPGWVRFGRDIWMDTLEMGQAEYRTLLGRNPSKVVGDSLPVTDVSWYDALLAANARSRRDGLDSVYEYVSVRLDAAGNAQDLPGLAVHPDRDGWRLPTEAEWEAAARAGSTTPFAWGTQADSALSDRYAWSRANASGRVRARGLLAANPWGLHDMSGNVMEWVGDWKGPYPRDTVEGFAGQESPGELPEIALKGGAYNHGLQQLRPSSRTATYAAYRASRSEYVGFRLVRGGFRARWANASGMSVEAPAVSILVPNLARRLGVSSARLVFVNRWEGKGLLAWVDYAETDPVVRSLPDRDPVFHPAISPDGAWVAWSTGLEGSTGPSRIKARRLARNDTLVVDLGEGAIPRWYATSADTFLIAAKALDNTSDEWARTRTVAHRWRRGRFEGEQTWAPSGSYHDGRSGSFLYTGYRRLRQWSLEGGADRILFTAPLNGKSAGDTSQVCNVSASPDTTGNVLFLDFGYEGISSLVGRPYGIHEIAFLSDVSGKVKRWIPAPANERQWEHLEWSNSPRWAISGAIDAKGAYRNLYAVDLETGSNLRIATGQELWQPALWLGSAVDLSPGRADPDSAGRYANVEIEFRLNHWWSRHDSVDVAILGNSHTAYGILPLEIHSLKAHLFGFAGASLPDQDEILRQYVLPHAPRLKVVVGSFMPGLMFESPLSSVRSTWRLMAASPGYAYDRNHGFWQAGFAQGFKEAVAQHVAGLAGRESMDRAGGWTYAAPTSSWWVQFSSEELIPNQTESNPALAENLGLQEAMIRDVTRSGMVYVLVKFPESPGYATTARATRYGPDWNQYHKLLGRVKAWETKYPGFFFYDAYQDGQHDFVDSEAVNTDHLNPNGARKMSRRLDSVIASHLP